MLFSSLIFLWVFLPILIITYFFAGFILKKNATKSREVKNLILLIFSMFFYAYGGLKYFILMFLVITINFFGGSLLDKCKSKTEKKIKLLMVLVLDLSILFVFKYLNFIVALIENIISMNSMMEVSATSKGIFDVAGNGTLGITKIILPIGISFYIFQAISYVLDVYREDAKVQDNYLDFALYISFFPQLIAGPIVQYSDVEKQITSRKEEMASFVKGIRRFSYGFGKKVIIANTMAVIADEIWKLTDLNIGAAVAWYGIIAYTLQIYYDFSGYSDMAIGLGYMFGFEFKENFNYPYLASSIKEFWRRWHISLSSWFKNYVYIPLGGSRCEKWKIYRNIFIVFLLTGIWHGANWTFLIWGLIYAFLLIIERGFLKEILDKNPFKLLNWFYTMFFVMIAWVFFRSADLYEALWYLKNLFTIGKSDYTLMSFLSMKNLILLPIAILGAGFIQKIWNRYMKKYKDSIILYYIDIVFQMIVLSFGILLLMNGTYNPFIYFQF